MRARWVHPALRDRAARRAGREGRAPAARPPVGDVDLDALRRGLGASVRGEVRFDAGHRAIYAHDSSNYRQPPLGIVFPRDVEDLVAAVAVAREHGAPVLPRGCGTSLAGQAVNAAVVIDASRHLGAVLDVDPGRRLARVQPGAVRDALAHPCERAHGLTFAPDTSTHAFATLGGMIGNNSCGVHSLTGGRTSDNVEELEVLLYDGSRMAVGTDEEDALDEIVSAGGRKGEVYARLRDLRDRYAPLIRERVPDIPRRVSGFNLDELLPERGFNVARALVGSEGTCATVIEAKLRLAPSPPDRTLLVLGYPSILAAADAVPALLAHAPIGLEALDGDLIETMARNRVGSRERTLLPEGHSYVFVELAGVTRAESDERARACLDAMAGARGAAQPSGHRLASESEARGLWRVRESALGGASYTPSGDHLPGWEDAAVPPGTEGAYLRDFKRLLDRYGYHAGLYGHFGQGCIHCRINFELDTRRGRERWRRFLDEAADLVVSYGGSLSGEHGDGQARAELLPRMFGDELVEAFREFKAIWDPEGGMNPRKVVEAYPILSHLKQDAGGATPDVGAHFAYPDEGGSFVRAARRCVGAGACRETATGTMCPSYMVSLEEEHTTRGRARILEEMLRWETIPDGFRSDHVHDALDLCLACKGCKSECPVSVDMATLKAEFLARHFRGRLRPREAYALGLVMVHARAAQRFAGLANRAARAPVLGALIKRAAGIDPRRELPPLARESFRARWRQRPVVNPEAEPVVLFPDTFGDLFEPGPLTAAVAVLEDAGRRVVVPRQALCCGRPLYDYGMLPTARALWRRTLGALRPHLRAGARLVGTEPSCVAAFREELPRLMPDDDDAVHLSRRAVTLAALLSEIGYDPPRLERRALVHGHCHHEAVMGVEPERELYTRMGLDFELLDSGCCGMAGAFGFERRHYDLSVAIGERRLLPRVRAAEPDALVIADGFSCRTQVAQLTGRRPLHTAEVLARARHG